MWNRTTDQINLILVRHGATAGNVRKCYIGRTDEPLSAEGEKGIRELKKQGIYGEADIVVVSPMVRCRRTAELLYPGQDYHIVDAFCEMDFGRFEGKNYQDLNGNADYQRWIDSGGTLAFPEGESRADFVARCGQGLVELLTKLQQEDEATALQQETQRRSEFTVAAVVHGGTIMALLSRFGGGDYYSYQCKNGEGYRCKLLYVAESGGKVLPQQIQITEIRRLG